MLIAIKEIGWKLGLRNNQKSGSQGKCVVGRWLGE
jgi:hypothetical protein